MRTQDIAVPVFEGRGLGGAVCEGWGRGQSRDGQGREQDGGNGNKRGCLRGAGRSAGVVAEVLGHGVILLLGGPEIGAGYKFQKRIYVEF